jgi:diguanylate cyclase (GGDEF)-like protein/PAS domain S-box-containing protein
MPTSPEGDPSHDQFHKTIVDNIADGVYFVDPGRKILYWNGGAERLSGYEPDAVVGHRCYDNILAHVDSSGRSLCHTTCPLAATIADGEPRDVTVWLRHSEGYRKPVRVRTSQVLDAEGRVIGGVETFSDASVVFRAMEDATRARRDAMTDDLTGLPNRRMFDAALAGRLENLSRYGWGFGLLFVDIDKFKCVNDDLGHAFGDAAIRTIAHTLQGAVRAGDMVTRWGGDEFAVIVASPDPSGLTETAERLRILTEETEARHDGLMRQMSISVGGTVATASDTADSLFRRADQALYAAKNGGRNRVSLL